MIQPLLEDPLGVIVLYGMCGGAALLAIYGLATLGLNIWVAMSLAKERRRR